MSQFDTVQCLYEHAALHGLASYDAEQRIVVDRVYAVRSGGRIKTMSLKKGTQDDAREGSSILPSSRLYKDLQQHAELVVAVLTSARSAGRVAIVTLARRPWVLTSSRRYLPGLEFENLLLELDIPVFYAQEYTSWLMWWFTDYFHRADVLVDGKRNAIMGCLRQLHTAGCEVRGLVSVGDSVIEQRAATEAVKAWTAARVTPQQVGCKTVKLADKPTVGELGDQLRVLNASLKPIVHHQGEVGVSMDDYDQLPALPVGPPLASAEKADSTGRLVVVAVALRALGPGMQLPHDCVFTAG
ncbi:unnamed protein product [Prorocentrum cordatum]|uniref:Uncharacterized protein n=1 Tax=Prorocentrum cordatum TaxID=2364126 RepID=A0ABN9TS05_9DINO|nr:unnamed protein product [Polarella glacialis]